MEQSLGKKVDFSGIIEQLGAEITFVNNGFCFEFMSKPYDFRDNHHDIVKIMPDEHGFVYGKLHDGRGIAIYTGQELPIIGNRTFATWCYIIVQDYDDMSRLNCIDGIRFFGGTVDTLYPPRSLGHDFENHSKNAFALKYTPDKTVFDLSASELKGRLELESVITAGHRDKKGFYMMNDGSRMDLLFDQCINLSNIEKLYNTIIAVLRFLSFRENVGFERIALLKRDNSFSEDDFYLEYAECHIPCSDSLTQRDSQRCISFRMLDSEKITKLFDAIMHETERKSSYCISFLPADDSKSMSVDNDIIKSTVSAIECELELAKLKLPKDEKMEALKKQVIRIVKESEDKSELNDKAYSVIFGSIDHWGDSLSNRIYEIYLLHKDEMAVFFKDLPEYDFNKAEIEKLVIYRNDITHGRYRVNNLDVVCATLCLMALVYCCILTRIGMEKSQIKSIMESGAFLYN